MIYFWVAPNIHLLVYLASLYCTCNDAFQTIPIRIRNEKICCCLELQNIFHLRDLSIISLTTHLLLTFSPSKWWRCWLLMNMQVKADKPIKTHCLNYHPLPSEPNKSPHHSVHWQINTHLRFLTICHHDRLFYFQDKSAFFPYGTIHYLWPGETQPISRKGIYFSNQNQEGYG